MAVNKYRSYERPNKTNKLTDARKKDLEKKRLEDRKPVRGIFKFYERPGNKMEFSIRLHAGDPIEYYELMDGEIYTLPIGIAKHLNDDCSYPIHAHAQDANGRVHKKVGKKVARCGFQSLDFTSNMSLHERTPDQQIVTVENI